MLKESVR